VRDLGQAGGDQSRLIGTALCLPKISSTLVKPLIREDVVGVK
jgi:hypothetical protein